MASPVRNSNIKLQWGEAYTFCTRTLTTKTSFRSSGLFKHDAVLMWALWGKWLHCNYPVWKSGVAPSTHNPRHWRSHEQTRKQSLEFRVVAYGLASFIWLTGIDFEHRHQSNSHLFYLFKHVSQYNDAGLQIAVKTGIPAGLLCQRIWYSVWKSGVLGITEYRQGRPLSRHTCTALYIT